MTQLESIKQLAGCEGKVAHSTKPMALKVLERIRRHDRKHAKDLNAYRCKYCQYWHLGNSW